MRWLWMIAFGLLISGCGLFGGKDDPSEPPAELVDLRNQIPVRKLWSAKVGGGGEDLRLGLAPATDGARIYAGSHDGRVSAFDAKSGRRLWSVDTKLPLAAGPAYGDGLLALGTSDGDLLALAAADGSERWRQPIGSEVLASPAIGSGVVAVRSVDGRLRGFAADDGADLWSVDQSVPRLTLRGNARPVIAGVTVVAGFDNGRLGAYDLTTGEAAWEFALAAPTGRTELDRLVDVSAGVKVVGDDVYAVGYQGRLLGIALESGQALWQRELSSYSGLDADWNNVYVTDDAGEGLGGGDEFIQAGGHPHAVGILGDPGGGQRLAVLE